MFALITLLLDRQSLTNGSASFADSLYGLRRAPFSADSVGEKQQPLTKRQRMTTLLCLVQFLELPDTVGLRLLPSAEQRVLICAGWPAVPSSKAAEAL